MAGQGGHHRISQQDRRTVNLEDRRKHNGNEQVHQEQAQGQLTVSYIVPLDDVRDEKERQKENADEQLF